MITRRHTGCYCPVVSCSSCEFTTVPGTRLTWASTTATLLTRRRDLVPSVTRPAWNWQVRPTAYNHHFLVLWVLATQHWTRDRHGAGSALTWFTASNLKQAANLLCAQVNLASCPRWDGEMSSSLPGMG